MVTPCPVCREPLGEGLETHGVHVLRECPRCSLQLWDPPDAPGAEWYDTSDHYLAMSVVDWLGWYHSWALARLPGVGATLLDIGCADGRFVYAAAHRGIDARGIDHSGRLIDEGNRRYGGGRLSRTSIEELVGAAQLFDIVTLFEVIEHVPDPAELLRRARGLLHPGGMLLVSTPNRGGYPPAPAHLDRPPHHLTRWTERALRLALSSDYHVDELALSPPAVGIKDLLLERTQLGFVRHVLRRRERGGEAVGAQRDVRTAILVKERAADVIATVMAPLIGRWFPGSHMVARATARE